MRKVLAPILLVFFGLFLTTYLAKKTFESFGATSPGTMVQLQTSHVPTQEDADFYNNVYPKMVRRDITEMTDGDPGELRPWIFPWYGRGMVLTK